MVLKYEIVWEIRASWHQFRKRGFSTAFENTEIAITGQSNKGIRQPTLILLANDGAYGETSCSFMFACTQKVWLLDYIARTAAVGKENWLLKLHQLIAGLQVKEQYTVGKTKPISLYNTSVGHLCSLALCFQVLGFTLLACVHAKALQSCPIFCDPMDWSLPASSAHEILQPRLLECIAMLSSRGSSWPRNQTPVSYVSCIGRQVLITSATQEALYSIRHLQ